MKVEQLDMEIVYPAPHSSRSIQPAVVATLTESMGSIGLNMPITVRPSKRIRNGVDADVWEIITGRHRFEAARRLNWTHIDGVIFQGDDRGARLWEIAENLHRADLTALERATQVAEWVKLADKPAQVGPVSERGGRGLKGGVNAAVRDLGVRRTDAQRAVKISSLTEEAKRAAVAVGLDDNAAALLTAADRRPSMQAQAVRDLAAGRARLPEKRGPLRDREVVWRERLLDVWGQGKDEWRANALVVLSKTEPSQ
jgi:ParB-like chromosome segregation protein Spo0J